MLHRSLDEAAGAASGEQPLQAAQRLRPQFAGAVHRRFTQEPVQVRHMVDRGDEDVAQGRRHEQQGEMKRFGDGLHGMRGPPGDVEKVARADVDHPMPLKVRRRLPDMPPIVLQARRVGGDEPALPAVELDDQIVAIVVMDDGSRAGLAPEQ